MNYSKTTHAIKVSVQPVYLEDQSSPDDHYFVWAYFIRIENRRKDTVQLINRHWQIIEANGLVQEFYGEGVIGEQPILRPGEAYEYTSGTPMKTSSGFMEGCYEMATEEGKFFDVAIPAFSLDSPFEPRVLQ